MLRCSQVEVISLENGSEAILLASDPTVDHTIHLIRNQKKANPTKKKQQHNFLFLTQDTRSGMLLPLPPLMF